MKNKCKYLPSPILYFLPRIVDNFLRHVFCLTNDYALHTPITPYWHFIMAIDVINGHAPSYPNQLR